MPTLLLPLLFILFACGLPSAGFTQGFHISSKTGEAFILIESPKIHSELERSLLPKDLRAKITSVLLTAHPDSLNYQYQRLYTKKGFYSDTDRLKNHLSPSTLSALKKSLKKLDGPGLSHHPRMKPWLLAETIHRLELQKTGFHSNPTLRYFIDWAQKDNKSILFLSTSNSALDLLSTLPDAQQVQYLKKVLRTSSERCTFLNQSLSFLEAEKEEKWLKFSKKEKSILPKKIRKIETQSINHTETTIQDLWKQEETPLLIINAIKFHQLPELLQSFRRKGIKIRKLNLP